MLSNEFIAYLWHKKKVYNAALCNILSNKKKEKKRIYAVVIHHCIDTRTHAHTHTHTHTLTHTHTHTHTHYTSEYQNGAGNANLLPGLPRK